MEWTQELRNLKSPDLLQLWSHVVRDGLGLLSVQPQSNLGSVQLHPVHRFLSLLHVVREQA